MAQASVLTDTEIRRVFRIIETTRHAERNRLAFVLSIFAGLRVGEIAALTVDDVATDKREVRREIKLGGHQTKGNKGCTVILATRVRKEIGGYLRTRENWRNEAQLIASQRNGGAFSTVSLSMLFKEIYEMASIRTSSSFRTANFCHPPECQRRWNADYSKADGASQHRHHGSVLRSVRCNDAECGRVAVSYISVQDACASSCTLNNNPCQDDAAYYKNGDCREVQHNCRFGPDILKVRIFIVSEGTRRSGGNRKVYVHCHRIIPT